jgi:hypothetical protein
MTQIAQNPASDTTRLAYHDRDEDIVLRRNDADALRSDFEAWRAFFRSSVRAQYTLECAEPDAFTLWVRPLNIFGFSAVDVACNKNRADTMLRTSEPPHWQFYESSAASDLTFL